MKYLSQVYSQASGSIGGVTYSHNRSGLYTRSRVTPVNPSSTQQQYVRNAFSYLADRWVNGLLQTQRDSWDLYASNVPVTDKMGQSIYLTGMNQYIRSNTIRQQLNNLVGSTAFSLIDDGPNIFTLADTDPNATLTLTAPTTGSLAFNDSMDWCSEDGAIFALYIGKPQNPGIKFYVNPYRIGAAVIGSASSPITSPAVAAAQFSYTAGQRCFSYGRISRADGRLSPIFRLASVLAT